MWGGNHLEVAEGCSETEVEIAIPITIPAWSDADICFSFYAFLCFPHTNVHLQVKYERLIWKTKHCIQFFFPSYPFCDHLEKTPYKYVYVPSPQNTPYYLPLPPSGSDSTNSGN